jgi:ubiquinone/menaquinone biosynthesis C-methylase UbiE
MFPDYVNVDIFDYAGSMPYRKGDIRKLPFDDNSCDEVFTCHVVEHFWPWELPEILEEWRRVLKPGGQIVTECPNLGGTAFLFLQALAENDEAAIKFMMNAFYGDPAPQFRHIEQRHKWGYTPESLSKVLVDAGFKNPRQASACFKMREPRDMRIVADK